VGEYDETRFSSASTKLSDDDRLVKRMYRSGVLKALFVMTSSYAVGVDGLLSLSSLLHVIEMPSSRIEGDLMIGNSGSSC
jgi:hypothetical protein